MTSVQKTPIERHLIDTDFMRSLLHGIALFRNVDPDAIAELLPQCGRIDIESGQVLLSPAKTNHCVYVVLSGGLEVHIGSRNSAKIADLPPGSCAGEMSLIEDKDPSAFVVATEDSHLMVISHDLLWQMVDRSHTFSKNLLVVLSERVRSDNEFIASSIGVLEQATQNAITDALTGLGNRRWMDDMFQRELLRTRQITPPTCLMMIDVDNFKRYNDRYGHIAGDQILAGVATALRDYLRPTDLIGRFGGDEFAVLLPHIELQAATETADRILDEIANLSPPSFLSQVTVSIGVTAAAARDDLDSIVHRADRAMYQAKTDGRNRVTVIVPS